MIPSLLLFS